MANIVVIPAQAGIQYLTGFLDARVRGHDNARLLQAIVRSVLTRKDCECPVWYLFRQPGLLTQVFFLEDPEPGGNSPFTPR